MLNLYEARAMSEEIETRKRQFRCTECNGLIVIPWNLPPTKGPCPHCGKPIESPPPPAPMPAVGQLAPAPMPMPTLLPAVPDSIPAPPPPAPAPLPTPLPEVPKPAVEPIVLPALHAGGVPAEAGPPGTAPLPDEALSALPDAGFLCEDELAASGEAEALEPAGAGPATTRLSEQVAPARPGRGQLVAVLLALLLVLGALVAAYFVAQRHLRGIEPAEQVDQEREAQIRRARYLRVGWRDDARKVLERFIAATTVEEKARWSIGGEALIPEMREFYGGARIDDSDTAAGAFSHFDLRIEDRERGMFLMIFDLPPQFEIAEFFRPLAPIEVQYGIESPDMLLASFARAANFVKDPIRVQAFFREDADGMKIDWHLFTQTKYRLFRAFQFSPSPARRAVFRVLVSEDVPDAGRNQTGERTYRLDDPIHASDAVRVKVPVDSEVGRVLSAVNWRGDGGADKPETRTATIELGWQGGDPPQLEISRFICWEFLGLGGKIETPGAAGK